MNENQEDKRYYLISSQFESLFKSKGYKQNNYFGNNVWFLQNDRYFQNLIKSQNSEIKNNETKLIQLLSELNKHESLSDLLVNVNEFIYDLSKIIYESYIAIEISENYISKNNSKEKIYKISSTIEELKLLIQNSNMNDSNKNSKIIIKILSMDNFKPGSYNFNLLINSDFDKDDINELNESEKNNMNKENDDCVFNLFKEGNIALLNEININKNGKIIFEDNLIEKGDYLNSTMQNFFDEYYFSYINNNLTEKYLIDRRYSGTTFSCFKLQIKGNGEIIEGENEYLLHILLGSINELSDLNTNSFVKYLTCDLKENKKVCLQIVFELDNITRMYILKRMKKLVSIPVENKEKNWRIITDILDLYFSEIKDKILSILRDENGNGCYNGSFCESCNII